MKDGWEGRSEYEKDVKDVKENEVLLVGRRMKRRRWKRERDGCGRERGGSYRVGVRKERRMVEVEGKSEEKELVLLGREDIVRQLHYPTI